MTIQYRANRVISGESGDTRPGTNTIVDTVFLETDTFKRYAWNGEEWIQYETLAMPFTNKTISAETNTISDLQLTSIFAQNAKRTGAIVPACTAADSLTGHLRGMTVNGDGTPTWSIDPTEGPVLAFARAASGIMGYTSAGTTDAMVTRRALNPYLKIRFKLSSISSTRLYIGFTSATALPNTDTPLATNESGVIFGYTSADSDFSVYYNDGQGGAMAEVETGVVKDVLYHTVSFQFGASNVIVILDDGADTKTQTLTTQIPATTTDIKLSIIGAF